MLDGIRVLDLSRVIAGPYCAMLLGDLGADVVKLERTGVGDELRATRGSGGMNAVFAALNRNKRSIAVDLQQADGRRLAFELACRADVIVENFLPGSAARLGLGYETIAEANPAVIYASISGFGQSGPYVQRPAYNTVVQGISGIMGLTGIPGGPPTRLGGTVTDLAAAFVAFGAINAALVRRLRTGGGERLDISLLASTLGLLPDVVAEYFHSGAGIGRHGNRNPLYAPAEAFRTADGYVNIVVLNQSQWQRLCQVLGTQDLLEDPAFADNSARVANRDEMVTRLERILSTAPTAEWVVRLERASVPCGPIYEFPQVFDDPQVRHLALLTEMEQPDYGTVRMLEPPFKSSVGRRQARRPAPRLGQHTRVILGELGLEAAEIERLAACGTIGLAPAAS